MKKFIIALFFLSLPAAAAAAVTGKSLDTPEGRLYTFYEGKNIIAKHYYDTTGITIKVDGIIPDGPVKVFHQQDPDYEEVVYKDGKMVSRRVMGSRGKIKSEEHFKDDRLHGINKTYFDNGIVALTQQYTNGVADGEKKTYYPNGSLESRIMYKGGDIQGTGDSYYEDGTLKSRMFFHKNRKIQLSEFSRDPKSRSWKSTFFFENGDIKEITLYENDLKEGVSKTFFESAPDIAQYIETYHRGQLLNRKTYSERGRLLSNENFTPKNSSTPVRK